MFNVIRSSVPKGAPYGSRRTSAFNGTTSSDFRLGMLASYRTILACSEFERALCQRSLGCRRRIRDQDFERSVASYAYSRNRSSEWFSRCGRTQYPHRSQQKETNRIAQIYLPNSPTIEPASAMTGGVDSLRLGLADAHAVGTLSDLRS